MFYDKMKITTFYIWFVLTKAFLWLRNSLYTLSHTFESMNGVPTIAVLTMADNKSW